MGYSSRTVRQYCTPIYLWLIAAAVLAVVMFGRRVVQMPRLFKGIVLIDALGLGAYAVVGMDRALAAGISLPGVVVVGMVNAVGGGILRDVLLNVEPDMFLPGTLDQASALIGCLLFLGLTQGLPVTQFAAAWITIALVFIIRLLAIGFRIESHPLPGFKAYWGRVDNGRDAR
jgi:uncharacterized membrane protein YeiH